MTPNYDDEYIGTLWGLALIVVSAVIFSLIIGA